MKSFIFEYERIVESALQREKIPSSANELIYVIYCLEAANSMEKKNSK